MDVCSQTNAAGDFGAKIARDVSELGSDIS